MHEPLFVWHLHPHTYVPTYVDSPTHTLLAHAGEWYEDELGAVHTCEGFEDPDCADRWYYTSIDDHMHYLGLPVGECRVVLM